MPVQPAIDRAEDEMADYFVYIMASKSRTIYTGITNDLERRVWEHKKKIIPGFTKKYNVTQLVWFESTTDVEDAILFEKKIKGWKRERKIALIEQTNADWRDLAADWFE